MMAGVKCPKCSLIGPLFGIQSVNLLLTIVTLGVYSFRGTIGAICG